MIVQMNTAELHRDPGPEDSDAELLSQAMVKIAAFWKLNNATLGGILGLSASTISRLKNGQGILDRGSKSFEAATFLLRLFRSLDALLGSDDKACRDWLAHKNLDFEMTPLQKIATFQGLIEVCDYVDSYRARV